MRGISFRGRRDMEMMLFLGIGIIAGWLVTHLYCRKKFKMLKVNFQKEINNCKNLAKEFNCNKKNEVVLAKSMVAAKPWLNFLHRIHNELFAYTEMIKFDSEDPVRMYVAMLHCSMIELVGSLVILFEERCTVGVVTLVRDMLENFVLARALIAEPNYINRVHAKALKMRIEMLEESKSGSNKYLSVLREYSDVDKKISEYRAMVEKIPKEFQKKVSIIERFRLAGMEDEYKTVYCWLCLSPHSEPDILEERHLDSASNNILLYKEITDQNSVYYLSMIAHWIVQSATLTHKFLNSSVYDKIEKYAEELESLEVK